MPGILRVIPVSNGNTVGASAQALFAVAVPLIVLPIALQSVTVTIVCACVLAVVALAAAFGLEPIGSGLLVLAFAAAPMNSLAPIGSMPNVELSDVLFVAGFLLLLPRLAGTTLRLPAPFLIGALGLLIVGTLSAVANSQPAADFNRLMQVVPGLVLLPILVAWWNPGGRATIAVAAAYMGGNVISVAACLFQAPPDGRYTGLTEQANYFGEALAMSLAIAPFLIEALPPRHRWIVGAGSVISVYGIWISGSRTGLVCAVAVTLLYPLLRRSIPTALTVAALCFPAILVVAHASEDTTSDNALRRLLGAGSASASDQQRAVFDRYGVDQFLSNPLLGGGWPWWIHNGYLQVAAAIGLLGLVCYLLIFSSVLRPLVTAPLPYRLLGVPALVAALISAADPWVGARYLWCLVALALAAYHQVALSEEPSGQVLGSATQPRASSSLPSTRKKIWERP